MPEPDFLRPGVAFSKEKDSCLLPVLGAAACFSARPDGTVDLPFDPVTGVLCPDVCNDGWTGTRFGWCQ